MASMKWNKTGIPGWAVSERLWDSRAVLLADRAAHGCLGNKGGSPAHMQSLSDLI